VAGGGVVSDVFGSGLVVASVVFAAGLVVVAGAGGASCCVGCELVAVEAGSGDGHGGWLRWVGVGGCG